MYPIALHLRSKPLRCVLLLFVICAVMLGGWLWSVCVRWQFVGAARNGDIRIVRAMLDNGMEPDTVSHIGGIRAISMAAYGGHTDIVRLLVDRGANPTYALPQAILKDRVDIIRLLIARGANVRQWQGYKMSPLQFAQHYGSAQVIGMFKAAGAE